MDQQGLDSGPHYFSVWDYVVFGAMLFVSASIGVYSACSGGKQKTADEFLVGNRKMGIFPVAMSLAVSYISAIAVISMPGEIYVYGTMFSWMMVTGALGDVLFCRLFLPIFLRINVISIYEFFEMRFNKALRLITNIAFSSFTLFYLGSVVYTPAIVLNAVTGFDLWTCILLTGVVCIFYTSVGGLKAVVWTDTVQGIIMIVGVVALIIKGTMVVGGLDKVWQIAEQGDRIQFLEGNPDPRILYTLWTMLIGSTINGARPNQVEVQRLIACGTKTRAIQALFLAVLFKGIIFALCIFSGLVMYAYYVNCDPWKSKVVSSRDQIMPLFVMELFAKLPGMPGVFLSSVVSASLSTLSSGVNALAAITAEDGVKAIWPNISEGNYARVAKILALVYGILAIGSSFCISFMQSGILQVCRHIVGVISGGFLGIFILAVFVHRCNSKGAVAGFVASFIVMVWIKVGSIIYPSSRGQLPLSVEGCPVPNGTYTTYTSPTTEWTTATLPGSTQEPISEELPAITNLYHISFLYYGLIGTIVCIITAMIVSYLTGFQDPELIDNRLKNHLTDALFCCFPGSLKRRMRCGFDKISYGEDDKLPVVQEEMTEVYTKKDELDHIDDHDNESINHINGHARPTTNTMDAI
ncbi:sodium-coupled monocarboxylate transporter 1-like [Lytechinus variegatus]|uniref:sodium-coupled monocarboxylate transporter 1-like n=1 Tax=Lytechinus variegatus TaxID=7654 RepID=UPI001BB137C2|nr:sodium-coupled monocarboxylate transporter 1-like [Lytechinus variegatus]